MPDFRFLIIGSGVMGSGAAIHLAAGTDSVGLLGPTEEMATRSRDVPKASHHDAGRNAHSLDEDPVWSELGARSVERYRPLEEETGIRFFDEIGYIRVDADRSSAETAAGWATRFAGYEPEVMSGAAANERFPYFSFDPEETVAYQARGAGRINPRLYVQAMTARAVASGATKIDDHAISLEVTPSGVTVATASGLAVTADRALVATGAYSTFDDLLPSTVPLHVRARTIVMVPADQGAQEALAGMPTVGCRPGNGRVRTYWHPPVRYPDDRFYLKIGGGPDGPERITSREDLDRWLRSPGDPAMADAYLSELTRMVPSLDLSGAVNGACATSETHSLRPYADAICGGRVVVLTGGNGHGAKAGDALGEIGAALLTGATWPVQAQPDTFALPRTAS